MSRLKTRVLSGTIIAAIVVFSLVCLAWATGRLTAGQPGPIFCAGTFVLTMVTVWATRTDGRRSQGRGDRC